MNILVTGGAGFIGSNFIHQLLTQTDHAIVNLDLLTYAANPLNLADFADHARYHFVKGDIADSALVLETLQRRQISAVVNFAAESHVDRSILSAKDFVHTNLVGTQTLLDAARQVGVERFLHVSTDEVYGALTENESPFTETSATCPTSPYAASKAGSDHLVLAAHRTFGLPAVITRCSNNYGRYQHPEKFIPLTIHRALNRLPIPVYGTGQNIRDWIHAEDHVRALLLVLEKGRAGEIYNIGGEAERRNLDIARLILRELGQSEELIQFVQDRLGHDFRYAINFNKIEKELGWWPKYQFEDGLKQTINWYRDNPKWLDAKTGENYRQYFESQYGKNL